MGVLHASSSCSGTHGVHTRNGFNTYFSKRLRGIHIYGMVPYKNMYCNQCLYAYIFTARMPWHARGAHDVPEGSLLANVMRYTPENVMAQPTAGIQAWSAWLHFKSKEHVLFRFKHCCSTLQKALHSTDICCIPFNHSGWTYESLIFDHTAQTYQPTNRSNLPAADIRAVYLSVWRSQQTCSWLVHESHLGQHTSAFKCIKTTMPACAWLMAANKSSSYSKRQRLSLGTKRYTTHKGQTEEDKSHWSHYTWPQAQQPLHVVSITAALTRALAHDGSLKTSSKPFEHLQWTREWRQGGFQCRMHDLRRNQSV
jgi:hypothetical protein